MNWNIFCNNFFCFSSIKFEKSHFMKRSQNSSTIALCSTRSAIAPSNDNATKSIILLEMILWTMHISNAIVFSAFLCIPAKWKQLRSEDDLSQALHSIDMHRINKLRWVALYSIDLHYFWFNEKKVKVYPRILCVTS